MAKDSSPLQNLNVEAKQAIEQTVKQTEGAMDNYFNLFMPKRKPGARQALSYRRFTTAAEAIRFRGAVACVNRGEICNRF